MESMKILLVAAEMAPLAQVGGLGDGGWLTARRAGCPRARCAGAYTRLSAESDPGSGNTGTAGYGAGPHCRDQPIQSAVSRVAAGNPAFLRRRGRPYVNKAGTPWADNADEFGTLSRTAASIASGTLGMGWQPDIVHCNDWHTGLTPIWMGLEGAAASVFTIHNAAYTGCYPPETLSSGLGFLITFIIPMLWSSTGAFRC